MNKYNIKITDSHRNKLTIAKDEIRLKINNNEKEYVYKVIEIVDKICEQIKYEDRSLRCYFDIDTYKFSIWWKDKQQKINKIIHI